MSNSLYEFKKQIKEKKLIVFGSGKYFRRFTDYFPELADRISFIVDSDSDKIGSTVALEGKDGQRSIEIKSISSVSELAPGSFVILFCASAWKEMKEKTDVILESEYTYFTFPLKIDYCRDREQAYFDRMVTPTLSILKDNNCLHGALELTGTKTSQKLNDMLRGKEISALPRIVVILTPKCTLRCKDCNNLMWAFKEKTDLQWNKILSSIRHMVESVDFIGCMELIGGEPFLESALADALEFLNNEKKVLSVEVTTNATVIPEQSILALLKNKKVLVRISNYGNVVDQTPFIECMQKNEIQYKILPTEKWISPGGIEKRNRPAELLIRQYYRCVPGYTCKSLWEDKLYPCARAASLAKLGIYEDCPYVDVSKKENLRERLIAFYQVPSCGACDYCDMAIDRENYVAPAIQMRGQNTF